MYLSYQAKALYRLLGNNTISFDHKSYDYPEDIPNIILDGRRINVFSVHFVYGGTGLSCELDDKFLREVIIKTDNADCRIDDAEFDKILNRYGLDMLFHDMYYESDESGDIGDYELDFLGLYPENIEDYEGLSKNEMVADIANTIRNKNTDGWEFPAETFILLNYCGSPIRTELKCLTIREISRTDGETIVELYSVDNERKEEDYSENLEHFSIEEVRRIYAIFKTIS